MANDFLKFAKGINLVPTIGSSPGNQAGDLTVNAANGKLLYNNGTSNENVLTEAGVATITDKTIDANNNTISNISNASIASDAAISRSKIAVDGYPRTLVYNDGTTGALASSQGLVELDSTPGNPVLTIGLSSGTGSLKLGNGSGAVILQADNANGNTTYKLPSLDGAPGGVLATDGSGNLSWSVSGSGASVTLNNLVSPTSINQSLIPNTNGTRDLGTPARPWGVVNTYAINSGTTELVIDSGNINVRANKITNLAAPTAASDAVNKQYVDSLSTTGATTTLSNLVSPTAINQDLIPSGSRNLGSTSNRFSTTYTNSVDAQGSSLVLNGSTISANNLRVINVATPTTSGDATNKTYVDSALSAVGFPAPTTAAVVAGGIIANPPTNQRFIHYKVTAGTACTLSATPFGTTNTPLNGTIVIVRGDWVDLSISQDVTLTSTNYNVAFGLTLLNGANFVLTRTGVIAFMFTEGRYHELFRRT